MHWAPWANVAIVIGIISGAIAIVAALRSVTRWVVGRGTATPAVESPQRAIQPPAQVIQAPIVIPPAQAPRDGGAASTIPGPGGTTGSSIFKTLTLGTSRQTDAPERLVAEPAPSVPVEASPSTGGPSPADGSCRLNVSHLASSPLTTITFGSEGEYFINGIRQPTLLPSGGPTMGALPVYRSGGDPASMAFAFPVTSITMTGMSACPLPRDGPQV